MTVYPFAIHLGPLELTGYGLMMMVAFLMAGWAIQLELRRRRMNEDYAADIVFAAVIGGIVGAKLWYVLLSGDFAHFRENFETSGVPSFNTDRAATLASTDRVKKIAANLKATVIIQHDARDVGKLPAFPAAAK